MSDKELIFMAANTFTRNLIDNLFGINTIGTDTLITYVVNNMQDKYGMYLEPFVDKGGNINIDLLSTAFSDVLKSRYSDGFILNIFGKQVKFNESDINEFKTIFKKLKAENGKDKN